jgi:RNA polymerase sigma-70 factor (ECF subfamily)
MPEDRFHNLDDEALVREHLANRRGPAAAALVARWQDRVYQWAYRVVRDRDAALDVSQDALVRMYQALPGYEPRGRFGAWLFAIVHNRARSAVQRRSLVHDPDVDADRLPSPRRGPEQEYADAQWEQQVLDAMERVLDPTERTALWMRAFEGMGMDDITRLLRLTNATGARGLLQTARRKLAAALRASAGDEGGDGWAT